MGVGVDYFELGDLHNTGTDIIIFHHDVINTCFPRARLKKVAGRTVTVKVRQRSLVLI